MGFRGSRVQIPPSRLHKSKHRTPLWPAVLLRSPNEVPFGVPFLPAAELEAAPDRLRHAVLPKLPGLAHDLEHGLGIRLSVDLEQRVHVLPPPRLR
jgi:hypothetical protein